MTAREVFGYVRAAAVSGIKGNRYMARLTIREQGEEILRKKSKPVRQMTTKLQTMIDDMFETMYETNGVGLAAPQIGVLKRMFVVDANWNHPLVFVNPEILEVSGEQTGSEGCLSVPGKHALVVRPSYVRIRAFDKYMKEFEYEATGFEARAILHEYDHLEGILYIDKAISEVKDVSEELTPLTEDAAADPEEIASEDGADDVPEMTREEIAEAVRRMDPKIVFMGTPDFAAASLQKLIDCGYNISLVVTQPDRPQKRSGKLIPSEVKLLAVSNGIPVFQPEDLLHEDAVERIRKERADLIVVAAFGQLLPPEVLEAAEYGCINVHGSLLPAYRGASPIQKAILDGQRVTGVTIMYMSEGLDEGEIITQKKVLIAPDETAGSLFDKMAAAGAALLADTIPLVLTGQAMITEQDEEQATFADRMTKDDGLLDWSWDAEKLERYVRGLDPWPGAFTYTGGRRVRILKSAIPDMDDRIGADLDGLFEKDDAPGMLREKNGRIFVKTGDDLLEILYLQPEGKRATKAADFLRGNELWESFDNIEKPLETDK